MEISWPVLVIVGFFLILLLLFIIIKNQKDEKELEKQLNEDYERPKRHQDNEDTAV
jgi:protein-S-isoprenylcysteine O-methyltransferase Ste14